MNKGNIVIVLVEPHSPGNIGSAARAMKNMGFQRFRLVNPPPWRDNHEYRQEAEKMAWNATDLLEKARIFTSLEQALSDVQWVIGTSARPGRYRQSEVLTDVTNSLSEKARSNVIAFLFGCEKRGLSTRELSHCHQLVTIPTSSDYPTLNLAQTVLLVCYQLTQTHDHQYSDEPVWADQNELGDFYDHMKRILIDIGFLNRQNPEHGLEIIRKVLGRTGLTHGEVRTLRGILRQIDWASHRWNPPLW